MNSSKVATKGAKRHHIVPRMLLRRFTIDPAADNPELWGLDISSGRPFASSVNNEAVIRHYYRIDEPNLPIGPNQAEEWLSRIESDAAVPIRKLVAGISLSQRERDSMALFLHVTQRRTPQSRAWHAYLDEQMHVEMLKFKLSNPDYIRQVYKGQPGFDTDDGIEAWRIQTLADLESGRLGIESGQNREVAYIFLAADRIVAGLSGATTWQSLRSPTGSEFVCSDNPLNIYDEAAQTRAREHAGVGWVSSPLVQATMPLDPSVCLLVTPGPPRWRATDIDAGTVAEINLRTYAAAEHFIYGRSQDVVQRVRASAKANRARVDKFRPRPPQFTIIDESVVGEPPIFTTLRPTGKAHRRPRRR